MPNDDDSRAIREQLTKILASSAFSGSERMCRFLRFAVERTLEGCGNQLKEYLIGMEVFDRKPSYDPRVDPIVRVEARRLRAKLRKYYDIEGRGDDLVIEFPTGRYVPVFHRRASAGLERRPAAAPVSAAPQPRPAGTIAVLPFANLSHEPDNEYFSDGLTQELIHALTRVHGLRVVAWNTAAQLRDEPHDICSIGRQLNVASILSGSVRRSGDRVRILAQLIDTSTGHYRWSETYDRKMEDLFAIQEEISRAIVSTLRIRLTDPAAFHRGAYNVEAYNLYLKGRFYWGKRTPEGLERSVGYFEEALAVDPGFALAYAGLADSLSLMAEYGLQPPSQVMPRARSAAQRALELDSTLAEAHTSLGLIRSLHDWEWAHAEQHYRRAIELNPGYATGHHWYAVDFLGPLGRFEEALAELSIAMDLDPLSPIIAEGRSYLLMLSRRYDEAIEHSRRVIELEPFFYKSYTGLGRALIQNGQFDEAVAMLEKGRSLAGDLPSILGALAQAHGLAGRPDEASRLIGRLYEMSGEKFVGSTCFAIAHLGLGENDKAIDWLGRAVERHELPVHSLKAHPAYDPIRPRPAFQALLRTIGMA